MLLLLNQTRNWIKAQNDPVAKQLYSILCAIRCIQCPVIPILHRTLYYIHINATGLFSSLLRAVYWTPLFKSRLDSPAPHLYLYNGMPYVTGPLDMSIGGNCRISGHTTFCGRSNSGKTALIIGNNVDISWQTTIAVGRKIVIGDNVRIAGRCCLIGYPGHPLNPVDRANGLPDREEQVGDIILEDNVWLSTNVSVMPGVIIGHGTVVASGSVVTHDLPPNVIAGGMPAKVIREIK